MYVVKLFVHIEVELTLFQTNTNSFTTYTVKLFVHIEVELTLFQTNTSSFTTYVVKLFVHIEVELTLFQTNTISLTLFMVMSPEFMKRLIYYPGSSNICSVALMQNFAFLP